VNDRPTARVARPHTTTATIARMSLGARAVHRKSALVGVVAACVVAAPVAAMTARVVGDSKRCDETKTTKNDDDDDDDDENDDDDARGEERATRGDERATREGDD